MRLKIDALKQKYETLKTVLESQTEQLNTSLTDQATLEEARQVIQVAAKEVQSQVHSRISGIVTRCLRSVFEDDAYEFLISFEMIRGKTEARLTFVRDGIEVDPLTASGGGVVDVAAFALRLAALVLSRPQRRRLLVLDEPFRFVSKEYRPRVASLLETLSTEMDIQFILVTHDPAFHLGKVIEL